MVKTMGVCDQIVGLMSEIEFDNDINQLRT